MPSTLSNQIERASYELIPFLYITGGTHPDRNSIPPTPTPSVLESRQEASIPDGEQPIWIVSGEDEGDGRETEAKNSPIQRLPVVG